jgi:ArsR family transcriptional regulator
MYIVKVCKALADETRIRLLNILIQHELNVGEIVASLGLGQSRISRHLKILTDNGLVQCRRDGSWAFYKAAENGPGRKFIQGILDFLSKEESLIQDNDKANQIIQERTQTTRQFFDAVAHYWERLSQDVLGDLNLAGHIFENIPESHIILDLGCGTGELIAQVLPKASEKIIGVDNSPNMLARARKGFSDQEKVSFRIGELDHLPLKDGEADCALMSMALHHLPHPQKSLQETFRVVSSQGTFIIADFVKHTDESMRTQYGDRWLGFDPEEVKKWIKSVGFDVLHYQELPAQKGLVVFLIISQKPLHS